jgi:hypothetical protein
MLNISKPPAATAASPAHTCSLGTLILPNLNGLLPTSVLRAGVGHLSKSEASP